MSNKSINYEADPAKALDFEAHANLFGWLFSTLCVLEETTPCVTPQGEESQETSPLDPTQVWPSRPSPILVQVLICILSL